MPSKQSIRVRFPADAFNFVLPCSDISNTGKRRKNMFSNSHKLWDFFKQPCTVGMPKRKTSICLARILLTYRVQYFKNSLPLPKSEHAHTMRGFGGTCNLQYGPRSHTREDIARQKLIFLLLNQIILKRTASMRHPKIMLKLI